MAAWWFPLLKVFANGGVVAVLRVATDIDGQYLPWLAGLFMAAMATFVLNVAGWILGEKLLWADSDAVSMQDWRFSWSLGCTALLVVGCVWVVVLQRRDGFRTLRSERGHTPHASSAPADGERLQKDGSGTSESNPAILSALQKDVNRGGASVFAQHQQRPFSQHYFSSVSPWRRPDQPHTKASECEDQSPVRPSPTSSPHSPGDGHPFENAHHDDLQQELAKRDEKIRYLEEQLGHQKACNNPDGKVDPGDVEPELSPEAERASAIYSQLRARLGREPVVVARFRPPTDLELAGTSECLEITRTSHDDQDSVTLYWDGTRVGEWQFDAAFLASDSQRLVSGYVLRALEASYGNRDLYLIADGQSGAGKSFSVFESKDSIMQAAAEFLFTSKVINTATHSISVSAIEVYDKRVNDLLSRKKPPAVFKNATKYKFQMDKEFVQSSTASDLSSLISLAESRRKTGAQRKNSKSSRGHLIMCFKVQSSRQEGRQEGRSWQFCVVDLAGSEDPDPHETDHKKMEEVQSINSSRESLFKHLRGISKSPREQMLSWALQELQPGRPSRPNIVFLTHVRPFREDISKSIQRLDCAIEIKNGRPSPPSHDPRPGFRQPS